MLSVRTRNTFQLALAALSLVAVAAFGNSCKNPDAVDPNLGFRLFDTPNVRVVMLDPRWRQTGSDDFSRVNLEQLRLTYHTIDDVLSEINNTKTSLDIAAFELSSQTMVNTLVQLANRGVTVRVVTESGQFSTIAPDPDGRPSPQALLSSLQQAGIQVRFDGDDLNRAMNARYAIIDNRLVIVGSADLLSQNFYDVANGDIRGAIHSLLLINSSRQLPPGGGAGEVNTLLDAFAFDFEEMFIRQRFGTAKTNLTKTGFDVGVPIEVYFGPKGNIRNALSETMFDTRARAAYSVGRFTDQILQNNFLVPATNRTDNVVGIFDGFLTPTGGNLIQNAGGLPYFYPGLNSLQHSWYAADFPAFSAEFQTPSPALADPVLFITTNPWTANSFDGDDAVALRVHDVAIAVRYGLIERQVLARATAINPQTGMVSDPPATVLIFGEVRSASNNAPLPASIRIRSNPIGYLPGDGGAPIEVETNEDTGAYFAIVPAGEITVDVTAVDGPFLLPPTIRNIGVRFAGGSEETNYFLSLFQGGTS